MRRYGCVEGGRPTAGTDLARDGDLGQMGQTMEGRRKAKTSKSRDAREI